VVTLEEIAVILVTLLAALLASSAQLLFKMGMDKVDSMRKVFRKLFTPVVIAGIIGYFGAFLIYIYALSKSDLSVVYPIFASSFIFTTLISAAVLREKINKYRAFGILLVFLGIIIIAVSA
jgi:drug/metabolite transporter (DMT)-like permease